MKEFVSIFKYVVSLVLCACGGWLTYSEPKPWLGLQLFALGLILGTVTLSNFRENQ